MNINSEIRLRAAQHKLLSEYPHSEAEQCLSQHIQSQELRKRLQNYRNVLHQKFVVFHIAETASSIEAELKASESLSEQIAQSHEKYADVFLTLAENLGNAAVQGVEGNYVSMLTQSVRAVVDFFQHDSALRTELYVELVKKIESGATQKLQAFVDGDASLDAYLNALRSEHFYFQSEIERLHRSGQITHTDFQAAIDISSRWKEEIITAIINVREYHFQRYAQLTEESKKIKAEPYRQLALRIVSEFLISPQQTGKIHGVGELDRLKIKFLNGRRDANITDIIKNEVSVRTEANLQGRSLEVDRSSKMLKALVATLKREVIANGRDLLIESNDSLLRLLSERLSLLLKSDLTEDEKLSFFADYYFNKIEEQSTVDEVLERRLIPAYGFFDSNEHKDNKGRLLFETLSHLGRDLFSDHEGDASPADVNKRLLLMQEKIQIVLEYYFIQFKRRLMASKQLWITNEKKVDLFVMNYLNRLLKQSEVSDFYHSYLRGLVQFKSTLPQPNQIVLTEDPDKPGQVKVRFLGGVFARLNALNNHDKKQWPKLQSLTFFSVPRERGASSVQTAAACYVESSP